MTVKQTLAAHLAASHSTAVTRRKPRTLAEMQEWHSREHHRFRLGHVHWDGTAEDANVGPGRRPQGWLTGQHERKRT